MKVKYCSECGFPKIWSKNLCRTCYYKSDYYKNKHPNFKPSQPSNPIKKVSEKRSGQIVENKKYYKRAIGENIIKNKGKCCCDNCGYVIKYPDGKNVSHIVSQGANSALYHHPLNHFILGTTLKGECNCEQKFSDEGKRSEMKIFAEYEHRRELLNNEFYTS